jgi:hypothetical protein
MRPSRHDDIRATLLRASDGLTAKEIGIKMDADCFAIRRAISHIYGVYIDRWVSPAKQGTYAAVYMCVPIPENTPRPKK